MPQTDIAGAVESNLRTQIKDFEVLTQTTDAALDLTETQWQNDKWSQYLGYYKSIPELKALIDAKATWTIGKGYEADPEVKLILDSIRGWGQDTFNTILENMVRTYHIGGDAFVEIIRDGKQLINLKPLDPGMMVIVVNKQGVIKRYEQLSKVKGKQPKRFQPEEIFHLARNRVADEIHGQSLISALEENILRINEAKDDWKRVLHRNIDPVWIFHLDTDNPTKINNFKKKMDAARGKGENMYIPKDAVVPELISIAPNAALNPLAWIEQETNSFYEAAGVPKIILGGTGGFTEAAVKIAYLAFQQTIEEEQLFMEEEVGQNLGIEIDLVFPASLENELLSDKAKDESSGATQPNDVIAETEGRT